MIFRRVAVTVRSAAGRQRTTGGLSDSDEGPRAGGAGCCFKQRYAAEVPGVLARKFQFLLSFLSKNTHCCPLSDGHSPRPQSIASAPRHSGAAAQVSRSARVTCRDPSGPSHSKLPVLNLSMNSYMTSPSCPGQ